MNNRSCLKYFAALAIAFSLNLEISAQTKPNNRSTEAIDFQNRLSDPWENPVLTHTFESATKINTIQFSPDGKMLASIGANQITLWRVNEGDIRRILPGHYASELGMEIAPTAIAFSPNSRFLATATWSQGLLTPDRSLIVRDIATGEKVLSLQSDGCRQVLFNIQGDIIYGACGLGVTAWSFPEGNKLFSFDTKYPLEAIALHPSGKLMATVDANTTAGEQGEKSDRIQLWQLDTDKPTLLNTLDGHANDIARIEFTADGERLVSSSYDGKINVWNWQQGTIYQRTNNLYSSNGLFSLSANSRLIAGNFHSSMMTDLITGLPLRNVTTIPKAQKADIIAFSPQGQVFASVKSASESNNSQIYLWQTNTSQEIERSNPRKTTVTEDNYLPISIAESWGDRQRTQETIDSDTSKPASIGKDPQAIALAGLGLSKIIESKPEQIQIDYPQENLAVVTITQSNLLDDSVTARRYLVKFAPYGEKSKQQWQVIWAGKQFKCQVNRGHQDWGANLCQ